MLFVTHPRRDQAWHASSTVEWARTRLPADSTGGCRRASERCDKGRRKREAHLGDRWAYDLGGQSRRRRERTYWGREDLSWLGGEVSEDVTAIVT
jgi:hypothetical protein